MSGDRNNPQPSTRNDSGLRAEHAYLLTGVFSLSAAIVAYVLDAALPIELNRGVYAILVSFFVAGYCGWLSRSAERRMRRVAVAELQRLREGQAEVRDALAELRDQMERQRTVYLPAPGREDGHMYVSGVGAAKVDSGREDAIEEGFELGWQARGADLKTVRLPQQKRRLTGDK